MTASTDIAFSPAVKAEQSRLGSRDAYARVEAKGGWSDRIDDALAQFIAARDSFYLATAAADGQPYVQHRGGPPGFLKVLDEKTLAFADFTGNRQYITIGNLAENPKAFLFLMDYANRRRIKIWGTAEAVEDDAELLARLTDMDYGGRPERAIRFHLNAWDANCPQHIPRLLPEPAVAHAIAKLQARIAALEKALADTARPPEAG